jgi:hypothetical protein
MNDSEEIDNSENIDNSEELLRSLENSIIIDKLSINTDSLLSSIYEYYNNNKNFYTNIEEISLITI